MASYGHRIHYIDSFGGFYRLSWTVDHHYRDSMLRYPRKHTRDTDEAGARRFAKKHRIEFQPPSQGGNEEKA